MELRNGLTFGDYYIADVSFSHQNPVHRVIAVVENTESMYTLFSSGYECQMTVNVDRDLHYFKLIERIGNMEKPYTKPPDDKIIIQQVPKRH